MKKKWTSSKGTKFEIDGTTLRWEKKETVYAISSKHETIFRTEADLLFYMNVTGQEIPKEDAE